MTKINYSVLLGAIASESAGSDNEWVELIKQAMNSIKGASDDRIKFYQELGDMFWDVVEQSGIKVLSEVTPK